MRINILKFPLRLVLIYLVSTFLLYLISPWSWPKENLTELVIFNTFIWLAIYVGFNRGVRSKFFERKEVFGILVKKRYWNFLLLLSLLFIYPNFLVRFQEDSLSITDVVTRLFLAFLDLKEAYFIKAESEFENTSIFSNPWILIYTFLGPVVYFVKFINLYYWKRLSIYQKVITLIVFFTDIMAFIAIGTNKGVFDYIVNIPFLVILFVYSKDRNPVIKMKKKFIRLIVLFLGLGLYFFGLTFQSRTKEKTMLYNYITNETIDYNTWYLQYIPSDFLRGYMGLDFYLTHAYNGLDKAMELEFNPMYGKGTSPILTQVLTKAGIVDDEISLSYEDRISSFYGAPKGTYWYTAYVAFANDVSLWGVPFLIYILAFFFGKAWNDLIRNNNIGALPIVTLFVIMFVYLNANNQILGKGQFLLFVILFVFWNFFIFKERKEGV